MGAGFIYTDSFAAYFFICIVAVAGIVCTIYVLSPLIPSPSLSFYSEQKTAEPSVCPVALVQPAPEELSAPKSALALYEEAMADCGGLTILLEMTDEERRHFDIFDLSFSWGKVLAYRAAKLNPWLEALNGVVTKDESTAAPEMKG